MMQNNYLFILGHILFEMATGREVGKYPPQPEEWEDVTSRDLQEVSSSMFPLRWEKSSGLKMATSPVSNRLLIKSLRVYPAN